MSLRKTNDHRDTHTHTNPQRRPPETHTPPTRREPQPDAHTKSHASTHQHPRARNAIRICNKTKAIGTSTLHTNTHAHGAHANIHSVSAHHHTQTHPAPTHYPATTVTHRTRTAHTLPSKHHTTTHTNKRPECALRRAPPTTRSHADHPLQQIATAMPCSAAHAACAHAHSMRTHTHQHVTAHAAGCCGGGCCGGCNGGGAGGTNGTSAAW